VCSSDLVAALAAVVAVLAVRSPLVLAAAAPVALAAAVAVGASPRDLLHRLLHVEGFLLVLAVLLPLTVPGPVWLAIGPIALSQPGVERAVVMLLRVGLAATAIFALLGGLEPARFGHGLARLGVPRKLVHLLLFTGRFVALVRDEAVRRHETMRARAFRPRTSLHTLRSLAHLVGRLLVGAFERAERVDEAMRCRAFAGRFALIDDDRFGAADRRFTVAVAALLSLLVMVDRLT
jgi:cobalt/nickel transport system permease protein